MVINKDAIKNNVKWELSIETSKNNYISIEDFLNSLKHRIPVAGLINIKLKAISSDFSLLKNLLQLPISLEIGNIPLTLSSKSNKVESYSTIGINNIEYHSISYEFKLQEKKKYDFSSINISIFSQKKDVLAQFQNEHVLMFHYGEKTIELTPISKNTYSIAQISPESQSKKIYHIVPDEEILGYWIVHDDSDGNNGVLSSTQDSEKKVLLLLGIPVNEIKWGNDLNNYKNHSMFLIYSTYPTEGVIYADVEASNIPDLLSKNIARTLTHVNNRYSFPIGMGIYSDSLDSIKPSVVNEIVNLIKNRSGNNNEIPYSVLDEIFEKVITENTLYQIQPNIATMSPYLFFVILLDPAKYLSIKKNGSGKYFDFEMQLVLVNNRNIFNPNVTNKLNIELISMPITVELRILSSLGNKIAALIKLLEQIGSQATNQFLNQIKQKTQGKDLVSTIEDIHSVVESKIEAQLNSLDSLHSDNKIKIIGTLGYKPIYGVDKGIGNIIQSKIKDVIEIKFVEKTFIGSEDGKYLVHFKLNIKSKLKKEAMSLKIYSFAHNNKGYEPRLENVKIEPNGSVEKEFKLEIVPQEENINDLSWVAIFLELVSLKNDKNNRAPQDLLVWLYTIHKVRELEKAKIDIDDQHLGTDVNSYNLFYEKPYVLVDKNYKFLIEKIIKECYAFYNPKDLDIVNQSDSNLRKEIKKLNSEKKLLIGVSFKDAWQEHSYNHFRQEKLLKLFKDLNANIDSDKIEKFINNLDTNTVFMWEIDEEEEEGVSVNLIGWDLIEKEDDFKIILRTTLGVY